MNAWSLLSSGALGIVVGWVAKELMDLVKRKLAHRHDLQRRFFEERLASSLKAMQMMKTSSSSLRGTMRVIERDIASGGTAIDRGIIEDTLKAYQENMRRMTETSLGALALLRFFHGETVAAKSDAAERDIVLPTMEKMSAIFKRMSEINQVVEELPDTQRSAAYARALLNDANLQRHATDALNLATRLDTVADEIINDLRELYKPVFGFGY